MKSDRKLVAHLMRRAGFGATPSELDRLTSEQTYDEIVEDLVNPERFNEIDMSYVERYYTGEPVAVHVGSGFTEWPIQKDRSRKRWPYFFTTFFLSHGGRANMAPPSTTKSTYSAMWV